VPELGGTVTIDDLTNFISGSMYDVASWPDTAATLRIAYDAILGGASAPSPLAAHPFPKAKPGPGWSADDYLYNGNDSFLAVNCADAPLPRNPALYPGIAAAFEKANPTFGRAEAFSEVACAADHRALQRPVEPAKRRRPCSWSTRPWPSRALSKMVGRRSARLARATQCRCGGGYCAAACFGAGCENREYGRRRAAVGYAAGGCDPAGRPDDAG
jgi:hypothetical protein